MCQIVAHTRALQRLPAFSFKQHGQQYYFYQRKIFTSSRSMVTSSAIDDQKSPEKEEEVSQEEMKSPWSADMVPDLSKKRGINKSRFRQHVNPLARKFQMPTDMISDEWPFDGTYEDPSLPLHIDIGCGKGGYLLSMAKNQMDAEEDDEPQNEKRNYLGLEIRPSVAQFARERITKRNLNGILDFVGCNANVDLDRILSRYTAGVDGDGNGGEIGLVSIQFPDPHFKKSHQKRRVVTPELVAVLAKYLPEGSEVFIQSDIKDVLDNMRLTLREEGSEFFTDAIDDSDEYMEENPTGIPTEREISVLDQNLPVYRTIFRRNGQRTS